MNSVKIINLPTAAIVGEASSKPTTAGGAAQTPTSTMAKLEVRSRTKRSKLATSKSLTQLVPRSLFFLRKSAESAENAIEGWPFGKQRCKSKQPFTKLTNELASPSPTKLYSPFCIETPEAGRVMAQKQVTKSKRKLELNKNNEQGNTNNINNDSKVQTIPDRCQATGDGAAAAATGARAVQLRLAHKEFKNFVSPTGKFRETVNYVEQSQRDIEAISKAIMTRSALNNIKNTSTIKNNN